METTAPVQLAGLESYAVSRLTLVIIQIIPAITEVFVDVVSWTITGTNNSTATAATLWEATGPSMWDSIASIL